MHRNHLEQEEASRAVRRVCRWSRMVGEERGEKGHRKK